jgi:hypothetical protein
MARKASSTSPKRKSAAPALQRPVRTRLFLFGMTVVLLCVTTILWMTFANISRERLGIWPWIFLSGLLALFFIASLAWEQVIPPLNRTSVKEWRKPKVFGGIVYLFLAATGFIVGVANIFDPPASRADLIDVGNSIKEDTGAILVRQGDIGNALGVGRVSLIRRNIDGIWGEPGCAVTYRLALNDRSLVMTSLRDEPGMAPFREEYTISSDADRAGPSGERLSIMETNEVAGPHDGQGVIFTYGGNGTSAWLEWKHRAQAINAPRFVQCGRERR